ncbi:hypothetical protein UNDKW_3770 [Undibacterium sp. KW1]|uniref:hypothetical protein n=1 Tax=Undibacterium sp. KW1 TaxID=2058624 RepID=UPI001331F810|nr:hypothetical protein [Undibacterium sp. KW1]BBB62043.1 hypothetical protein UNDKW_3770 [Undibacterium sp. KW1]
MNNYFPGSFRLLSSLVLGVALLPAIANAQVTAKSTTYITEASLHCDELNVTVETYCEANERLDGACFLQKVKLRQSGTDKFSEKLYLYEDYLKDRSLITQLACVKGKGGKGKEDKSRNKIVLSSTNLGNCKSCEWDDYFSETGVFLGSSREKFGATNFKPRALPGNLLQRHGFVLDDNGRFTEIEKVSVKRIQREGK